MDGRVGEVKRPITIFIQGPKSLSIYSFFFFEDQDILNKEVMVS